MDKQQRTGSHRQARSVALLTALTVGGAQLLTGCGLLSEPTVVVNVGYQSKTINTVNAGTLLRDRGDTGRGRRRRR